MKVFALVIAILYFVVAGVEAALIVIAVMVCPSMSNSWGMHVALCGESSASAS